MFGITDLPAYVLGAIAIILLPGPNSMYCLSVATRYGVAAAYRTIAAILVGDSILMLATILGADAMFRLHPMLFHGLKLFGGLYLAYIGWNLICGAFKKYRLKMVVKNEEQHQKEQLTPNVFRHALVLSLANPKAILFFLSFFVQFADPNYAKPWLTFLVLAIILQIISFGYLSVLTFVGNKMVVAFRNHQRLSAVAMGIVGLMFMGFAAKLWTAAL